MRKNPDRFLTNFGFARIPSPYPEYGTDPKLARKMQKESAISGKDLIPTPDGDLPIRLAYTEGDSLSRWATAKWGWNDPFRMVIVHQTSGDIFEVYNAWGTNFTNLKNIGLWGGNLQGTWNKKYRFKNYAPTPGQQLVFVRVPEHRFEPNAIGIYHDSHLIGWVDAATASELAPIMDSGKQLIAISLGDIRWLAGEHQVLTNLWKSSTFIQHHGPML